MGIIIFPHQMAAAISNTDLAPVLFLLRIFTATHPLKTKRVSQEASAKKPSWPLEIMVKPVPTLWKIESLLWKISSKMENVEEIYWYIWAMFIPCSLAFL